MKLRATTRRLASARTVICAMGFLGLGLVFAPACNLGPFPEFLEPLDVIQPVEGDATAWIMAGETDTDILVLSEDGQFMHSVVGHDTSVDVEFGTYELADDQLSLMRESRFVFPKEPGSVNSRLGARPQEPRDDETVPFAMSDGKLELEGWGSFTSSSEFVSGLNLSAVDEQGCLLKYVQLAIRTIQARIRNFGGGGTVIYHNNESSFAGFLQGEQSIVIENLLSPDTTISYDALIDIPEIQLDGSFVTHVDTSGDGELDESVEFTITAQSTSTAPGPGESAGPGGSGGGDGRIVIAEGSLAYGGDDPLTLKTADVVGGSYEFILRQPNESSEIFGWEFLEDLDMRSCLE